MNKTKIQFIGFKNIPNKKADEIFRVRRVKWLASGEGYSSDESLSFHDYNIVFINYTHKLPYPTESSGFLAYIEGGGIIVIFLGPSDDYPWWEEFIYISLGEGDTIIPDQKHWLKSILKKYPFTWRCLISGNFLEIDGYKNYNFEIAATAVSGKCVSSVIHHGSGKLILLPMLEEVTADLIRELIDGIKENYLQSSMTSEPRPSWIEKWNLHPEIKLKEELNTLNYEMDTIIKKADKIKEKQEWYESLKKILYSQGKELSFSVNLILKEMGFEAILKEEEGHQDIEIKLNYFFAIIEVKGLKGFANNNDLRQLLEYYATASENNPEVKGIFIVNNFRDIDPSERGISYSAAAINLATKNEFCLLTTVDLFKMYNQFLDGKITTDQIKILFQTTKGLLRY